MYVNRQQFERLYTEIDRSDSDIALQSVLATCPEADFNHDGELGGIAVLIKDNIEAIGLPGSAGSLALMPTPATRDAQLVTRLRQAGADIVGSANLSEWANLRSTHGTSGWSAVGGLTANPWALDRSAGGSSSGSGASVAAGLVSVAIGSETDGSIVCPASLNGVVGLKPTVGTVSVHGVVPISESQDTPGPLAIDVSLAARVYEVISGRVGISEAIGESTAITRSLKIGVAKNWLTDHTATDAVFSDAVRKVASLVASVNDCDAPEADGEVHNDEYTVLANEILDDMQRYLADRIPGGELADLKSIHQFNLDNHSTELKYFGQEIFDLAITLQGRTGAEYREARARNYKWATEACLKPAFEKFDLLIAPAYGPAWKSDLVLGDRLAGGKVTTPSAIAGWPLLCIPMGLVDGLPVGLTIVGRELDEARMLGFAEELMKHFGTRPEDGFIPKFHKPRRG